MKTLELDKFDQTKINAGSLKDWLIMENLFDMNDGRFNVFKQHLLQVIQNIDKPLFLQTFERFCKAHDDGKYGAGLIEWYDFKKAMDLKELNYDAYTFCFALLCIKPGEVQTEYSGGMQTEKIKELHEAGLNRGIVEEVVENFMLASPKTFGVYLQVLEMMKTSFVVPQLSKS